MTKNQIIERQSKLILDLLAIGKEKMQEVSDLFAAIERERAGLPDEPKAKKRGSWPKGRPRGRKV